MILALMVYVLAVTTLFAVAATAAERLLRLARRPARIVWIVAMIASLGVSIGRMVSDAPIPPAVAPTAAPVVDLSRIDVGPRSRWTPPRAQQNALVATIREAFARANVTQVQIANGSSVSKFDQPLVTAWTIISMLSLIVIGISAVRLARPRPTWAPRSVDGIPVLVSRDLGPAVVGVVRYRIVLPAWALELSPVQRDFVLTHEAEHARAGDPTLLFIGAVLVALTPWNAPLWWMSRRLRFAIELDCDARVLRHRPDPIAYGSLLLDISQRSMHGAIPLAALAEPVSLVERRIAAMTAQLPRFSRVRRLGASIAAVALIAMACVTPRPAKAPEPQLAPTADPRPVSPAGRDSLLRALDESLRKVDALGPAIDSLTRNIDRAARELRAQSQSASDSARSIWRFAPQRAPWDSAQPWSPLLLADSMWKWQARDSSAFGATLRANRGAWAAQDSLFRMLQTWDSANYRFDVREGRRSPARTDSLALDRLMRVDPLRARLDSVRMANAFSSMAVRAQLDSVQQVAALSQMRANAARDSAQFAQATLSGALVRRLDSTVAAAGGRIPPRYPAEVIPAQWRAVADLAFARARQLHPAAFARHDSTVVLVAILFDSTGTVLEHDVASRALTNRNEMYEGRAVLAEVLPKHPLEGQWATGIGVMAVEGGGRVVVAYGFRGRYPTVIGVTRW